MKRLIISLAILFQLFSSSNSVLGFHNPVIPQNQIQKILIGRWRGEIYVESGSDSVDKYIIEFEMESNDKLVYNIFENNHWNSNIVLTYFFVGDEMHVSGYSTGYRYEAVWAIQNEGKNLLINGILRNQIGGGIFEQVPINISWALVSIILWLFTFILAFIPFVKKAKKIFPIKETGEKEFRQDVAFPNKKYLHVIGWIISIILGITLSTFLWEHSFFFPSYRIKLPWDSIIELGLLTISFIVSAKLIQLLIYYKNRPSVFWESITIFIISVLLFSGITEILIPLGNLISYIRFGLYP